MPVCLATCKRQRCVVSNTVVKLSVRTLADRRSFNTERQQSVVIVTVPHSRPVVHKPTVANCWLQCYTVALGYTECSQQLAVGLTGREMLTSST